MESLLCHSPKLLPLPPAQPWRTRTPRACPASARSQAPLLATSATTFTSPMLGSLVDRVTTPASAQMMPVNFQVWTSRTRCLNLVRRAPLPSGTRCQAAADQAEEPLTVDNSTVLVVGGGGVGMETVRALAKAGSWVTAYQRGEKFRKEIEGLGSMLALGDVLDVGTIEKVLRSNSFDAIVSTVGGGTTQPNVDKDGPINLVNAAKKAGVKRIILISSIGAGDSVKAIDDKTLSVLKTVLEAKEAAEEAVKSSGLDYTIIRPGGLLAAPPSGNGILTENSGIAGLISRGDVATLILKVLFNEKSYQKTLSAIDQDKLLPPTTSLDGVEFLTL